MEPETLTIDQQLKNFALETLQGGKEFAIEQAPLVITDYLAWGIWGNLCLAGGLMLGVIACLSMARIFWNRTMKEDKGEEAGVFVSLLAATVLLGFSGFWASQAVKAKVAPRAYIIDTMLSKSTRSR